MPTPRSLDLATAAGVAWEFAPADGDWAPICVPGGGWRAQGYTCNSGTYRTRLLIPAEAAGQTVHLVFAAINFGARIFAGPDAEHLTLMVTHVNGWVPVVVDLTALAVPGEELLVVVEVAGRGTFWRDGKLLVPDGATWYDGVADGIIRGVALHLLPPIYIDDCFVRTSVAGDALGPEVTLCNTTGARVELQVHGALSSAGPAEFAYPTLPSVRVTLEAGERRTVSLTWTGWGLGRASYWWPNVPYRAGYRAQLHQLSLTLEVDGAPVHTHAQRFGFREFTVNGTHYRLNGIRCNLRGDNQQEANFGTDAYGIFPGFGPPTSENPGWPQAVDNLQRANFNVLRVHQIPATPYMLDVCDELGLMIVDESPVRGSEGLQDFVGGRDYMVAIDRELTLRDRRHPSIVIWSAANETWGQRGLMLACQAAILAVDDTRPVIVDGVEDLGWPLINMEHYLGGLGVFPETGGTPRLDRPFGETESLWPKDTSPQGFVWLSTATRIRRAKDNADIRNYVLNNLWSNYVPGQAPELQVLEKRVKGMQWAMDPKFGDAILPAIADPWTDPFIDLLQKSFCPVAVFDIYFDAENKLSDEQGTWPAVKPTLNSGHAVTRHLIIFNDEFAGEEVTVEWDARRDSPTGPVQAHGVFTLPIPLGEYRKRTITFPAPQAPGELYLVLRSRKDGAVRFCDERIVFTVRA
jgi:hypothetical protein